MLKIFIAIVILVVLWFLWIILGDEEEEGFGSFICIFIAATGVCAIIGAAIGKLMQNWSRGALIGSIIGVIIYRFCKGVNYQEVKEKQIEQQEAAVRQILSRPWRCPKCGKINDPDSNICPNVFMRFYENGNLREQYFDGVQGYRLFFDRENYEKYVYLKTCIGWRCDVCGSVNAGGFTCKNCGVKRGILSSHYSEYIKNVDERSHIRNEYYPDGEVKTETVYDD